MCMDTTIIHYLNEEDKKQDKLDKIEEAKRVYMERKAQREKEKQKTQDALTIKLKD